MGAMTQAEQAKTQSKAGEKPRLIVPFTRASREIEEPFVDKTSAALSGNTQQLGPFDVPARGFLASVFLIVTATGGGGTAAVAKEDAPFSVIESISLQDVNGGNLIVPVTGYDLYLIHKFGGYDFSPNPKASPLFTTTQTDGTFKFAVRLPVQINRRDALGALKNQDSSQNFKLNVTLAAKSAVYTTDPTTLPVVRVQAWMEAWSQPPGVDSAGNVVAQTPLAEGTTQFWRKATVNVVSGQQTVKMPHLGNLVRNLILVYRTTTPARSNTNFPSNPVFEFDSRTLHDRDRDQWRHYMAERYGFATADLDTGVFVLDMTHDFDGHPGAEVRDLWLPTASGSRFEFKGSFGADGTLTILTNEVAPVAQITEPLAA